MVSLDWLSGRLSKSAHDAPLSFDEVTFANVQGVNLFVSGVVWFRPRNVRRGSDLVAPKAQFDKVTLIMPIKRLKVLVYSFTGLAPESKISMFHADCSEVGVSNPDDPRVLINMSLDRPR
jgi:hypothetical protein